MNMSVLISRIAIIGFLLVVGVALFVGGLATFHPVEVLAIDSSHASYLKVNYLAPKVVLAQGAPANNKLLELSCPWANGPKVLGSQSGAISPQLTVDDATGVCSAPSCPLSHPTLVANYCVPTAIDIPFTVVPTQGSSHQFPPGPPIYHSVVGGNPTFYYHLVTGSNASPYTPGGGPGGGTPGGGSASTGGNGSGGGPTGGGGLTGTSCAQHTYAGGQGAWCGGSCPANQTCRITGNSSVPCSCQDRDSVIGPNGNIAYDYPLLEKDAWGGPLYSGTYTSTGEPGGGIPPGDTGTGEPSASENGGEGKLNGVSNLTLQFSTSPASFAGPGTGVFSNGLYTPDTWWYATLGVCVNVCR